MFEGLEILPDVIPIFVLDIFANYNEDLYWPLSTTVGSLTLLYYPAAEDFCFMSGSAYFIYGTNVW